MIDDDDWNQMDEIKRLLGGRELKVKQPTNRPSLSAIIGADYKEFEPETLKGFNVSFSDEPPGQRKLFRSYEDALRHAHSRTEHIYHSSSIDNYTNDLRAFMEAQRH